MQDISIKIAIAGRTYPLTIKREKEEFLRKAAKLIDEKIRDYEQNYSVRDKQDLLAMCALHFVNLFIELDGKSSSVDAKTVEEFLRLDKLIDDCLNDN
jgi:cell division protein ZapA (FtsZ GTPase activity inhibitor)